jgi:hypothetical protein
MPFVLGFPSVRGHIYPQPAALTALLVVAKAHQLNQALLEPEAPQRRQLHLPYHFSLAAEIP